MAQWGEKRRFVSSTAEIEVIPNVDTGGAFDPLTYDSKIDSLQLMNVEGDRAEAEQVFERVKAFYTGLPYVSWQRPISSRQAAFLESQGLPPNCDAGLFSDLVVCPCGVRFDVNDACPPKCPAAEYKAPKTRYDADIEHLDSNSGVRTAGSRLSDRYYDPRDYRHAVAAARRRGVAVERGKGLSRYQTTPPFYSPFRTASTEDLIDHTGKLALAFALTVAGVVIGWRYGPAVWAYLAACPVC